MDVQAKRLLTGYTEALTDGKDSRQAAKTN